LEINTSQITTHITLYGQAHSPAPQALPVKKGFEILNESSGIVITGTQTVKSFRESLAKRKKQKFLGGYASVPQMIMLSFVAVH